MGKRKILIISLVLLSWGLISIYLGKEQVYLKKKNTLENNSLIGFNYNKDCKHILEIKEINLKECLYAKNNKKNSLKYGLEVLKEKPLVIAGHSGTGYLAIFNDLNKLSIESNITMDNSNYRVVKKYLKKKEDKLKLENDLILVTCLDDHQLILEAKKEKN